MARSGTTEVLPVEDVVNAYESVRARDPVSIRQFLPARDDSRFLPALVELIRVEMEYAWGEGTARRLADYRAEYPELAADPKGLAAVAFEEFRLRRQAGEAATREEYARNFGVDTSAWPEEPGSVRELSERLAAAEVHFPEPGATVAGFRLERELGRGAFGRVFLARQGDLADRPVALKIAADVGAESRALARLQHTNVMPVYSVHRTGPFQAVCMPFFPAVTLADLCRSLSKRDTLPDSGQALLDTLRARTALAGQPTGSDPTAPEPPAPPVKANLELLAGVSFPRAVVWLGARLADGLAHAHERGIVHRDLKPANILLTDEGQPLILDFNLAADLNPTAEQARAALGGTLPYMPPEHLQAFRDRKPFRDPRGDVYALGLILFELLAGRHPFPVRRGGPETVLADMIADRQSPPSVREFNPAVSGAVEAILCQCLDVDPDRRYPTGRELHEDLQRQFDDQPLKHAREPWAERMGKWRRQHPRLLWRSVGAIASAGLVAAVLLAVWQYDRGERLADRALVARFHADFEDKHFRAAFPTPEGSGNPDDPDLMHRFRERWAEVFDAGPDHPRWTRALSAGDYHRLRRELGDSHYLLGEERVHRPDGRAADAAALREALADNDRARAAYPPGELPRALLIQRAAVLRDLGEPAAADVEAEAERTPIKPGHDQLWTARELIQKQRRAEAEPLLREASRLDPTDPLIQAYLGWVCRGSRRFAEAAEHFGLSIGLYDRRMVEAAGEGGDAQLNLDAVYNARGQVYLLARRHGDAEQDFTQVIWSRPEYLDAFVNRALAREYAREYRAALVDLNHVLSTTPGRTDVLFQRARVRRLAGDPAGAAADHAAGLRSTPTTARGYLARASARVNRPPADGWLGPVANRARVLAALDDVEKAIRLEPNFDPGPQQLANLLSEFLGRPDDAIAVLNELLKRSPEFIDARAGRAVLLARAGKDAAALADADAVLRMDPPPEPLIIYQVADVYALVSARDPKQKKTALDLFARAFREEPTLVNEVPGDPDLNPIRQDREFLRVIDAARTLGRSVK